jgi:hypothetical protein
MVQLFELVSALKKAEANKRVEKAAFYSTKLKPV